MAPENKLFEKINQQLKQAMKDKAAQRLSTLRMMKSKILYVDARGDLSDAEIIKILTKYAKELKESIEEFKKANNLEEVEKHQQELAIVQEFLPRELSSQEIKALVKQAISEIGADSIKQMGQVMKTVLSKQPGIDGKIVSQFVREILK